MYFLTVFFFPPPPLPHTTGSRPSGTINFYSLGELDIKGHIFYLWTSSSSRVLKDSSLSCMIYFVPTGPSSLKVTLYITQKVYTKQGRIRDSIGPTLKVFPLLQTRWHKSRETGIGPGYTHRDHQFNRFTLLLRPRNLYIYTLRVCVYVYACVCLCMYMNEKL